MLSRNGEMFGSGWSKPGSSPGSGAVVRRAGPRLRLESPGPLLPVGSRAGVSVPSKGICLSSPRVPFEVSRVPYVTSRLRLNICPANELL